MNKVFIELQRASGLSNFECGQYLGISEGAVRDRRRGVSAARRSELIALAIFGSQAEVAAVALLQQYCTHDFVSAGEGLACRWCRLLNS